MEDHIHGFRHAAQFLNDYSALACRQKELQPIVRAFKRNMNRVRGLGALPINLVATSVINEAARVEASANLKIPFHDQRVTRNHPSFDPILFAQLDLERMRIVDEWIKNSPGFDNRAFEMGIYAMNLIIASNKEEGGQAIQATMAAMLIGLWTAFESLAQDTWIAAVDGRPVPLAQRILEPGADLKTGEQSKSISWKVIARAGFNLRPSMGQILLRERKVDFNN